LTESVANSDFLRIAQYSAVCLLSYC